jgi:tetratricopeptide (TPR) repeat protein
MRSTLKHLSAVCAGTLLLACADLGHRMPAAASAALPGTADDVYVRGRQQHLAQRFDAAIQSYRAALDADPAHVNARNGLAALHAEQGEFAKAILIWQELTNGAASAGGPRTAFLFSNLGYAYFLNGEYENALAALEKACLLDPLNHRAWQHLGSALQKLGQDERAQLMYKQAAALRQHDFKADYAVAQRAGVAPIDNAVQAPERRAQEWAKTDVRETAIGIYEVRRVERPAAIASNLPQAQAKAQAQASVSRDTAMLEIRNGNGVTGMARALARTMDDDSLRVVRLSNEKGFAVQRTRVEYQPAFRDAAARLAERFGAATVLAVDDRKSADVRLVIGHDLIRAKVAVRPPARPALAAKVGANPAS